jgi:hypothetical protein
MNQTRKSDSPEVPMKSPNNAGQPAAETAKERDWPKGTCLSKTCPGLRAGRFCRLRNSTAEHDHLLVQNIC